MAFSPTSLGSQYMMNGRIHNNDEGRWQHPELTGQRLRTKSFTSQFNSVLSMNLYILTVEKIAKKMKY
jgi:hypothetical protein